jgi:flagellar hook protein FlgE
LTDGAKKYYTRAGAFSLDDTGNLVAANGMMVCDSAGAAINLGNNASNISIASDGSISYTDSTGAAATTKPIIGLTTFTNPAGLTKVGENMYTESTASGTIANSTAVLTAPDKNSGKLTAGALEMSNVDLAQEFVNMIVAQRGFQANSKSIQTSDTMLDTLIQIIR